MRYLGQFPSEAQVRDAILPEVFMFYKLVIDLIRLTR